MENAYEAGPSLLTASADQELIAAVLELVPGTLRATAVGLAQVPPEGTGLQVELSSSDGRFGEAVVKSLADQLPGPFPFRPVALRLAGCKIHPPPAMDQ